MKLSSIAVPMLVLVITSLSLTNYVNIKAKKLDYTTGSDNKYYDMNTHEYYFYQLTSEVDKENYRKIQDALNNLEPKIKLKEVYTFDKMKTLIYFVLMIIQRYFGLVIASTVKYISLEMEVQI